MILSNYIFVVAGLMSIFVYDVNVGGNRSIAL